MKQMIGAVFVDLTAAYDTVNKRMMLQKHFDVTLEQHLTSMTGEFFSNRRFFVEMGPRKSTWRKPQKGLPHVCVLAPLLFNVYTNDQPIQRDTKSFIYADGRAILLDDEQKL